MDITLGHDEELLGFSDLDLIFKVTAGLKLPNLRDGHHGIIMSLAEGEGDILFFGVDPVGVSVGVTRSCLHDIS